MAMLISRRVRDEIMKRSVQFLPTVAQSLDRPANVQCPPHVELTVAYTERKSATIG